MDSDAITHWHRGYAAALEALGAKSIHAKQARSIRKTYGYERFELKPKPECQCSVCQS